MSKLKKEQFILLPLLLINLIYADNLRVVSLDWFSTAILLSIGIKPIGTPKPHDYKKFIDIPMLPNDISDIASPTKDLRSVYHITAKHFIDLNKVKALKPDIIIGVSSHAYMFPTDALSKIAETHTFNSHRFGFEKDIKLIITIGRITKLPYKAAHFINSLFHSISNNIQQIKGIIHSSSVMVGRVNCDKNKGYEVYMIGPGSSIYNALKSSNINNIYQVINHNNNPTKIYSLLLREHVDYMFLLGPMNSHCYNSLAQYNTWASLDFVAKNRMLYLDPVYIDGGIIGVEQFMRKALWALKQRKALSDSIMSLKY